MSNSFFEDLFVTNLSDRASKKHEQESLFSAFLMHQFSKVHQHLNWSDLTPQSEAKQLLYRLKDQHENFGERIYFVIDKGFKVVAYHLPDGFSHSIPQLEKIPNLNVFTLFPEATWGSLVGLVKGVSESKAFKLNKASLLVNENQFLTAEVEGGFLEGLYFLSFDIKEQTPKSTDQLAAASGNVPSSPTGYHNGVYELIKEKVEEIDRIFNTVPVVIAVLNKKGVFESVNSAFYKVFGYGDKEILGAHFEKLVHESEQDKWNEHLAAFTKDEAPIHGTFKMKEVGGETFSTIVNSTKFSADNNEEKIIVFIKGKESQKEQLDDTPDSSLSKEEQEEFKNLLKVFKEKIEELDHIFKAIPLVVVVVNQDGKLQHVNHAFNKVFDWSEKDFSAKNADDLFTLRSLEKWQQEFKRLVKQDQPIATDFEFQNTKNEVFSSFVFATKFTAQDDESRVVIFMKGHSQTDEFKPANNSGEEQQFYQSADMADLTHANFLLNEKIKLIDKVYYAAPMVIMMLGENGEIKSVNPAFDKVFRYGDSELDKVVFQDLLSQESADAWKAAIQAMINGEKDAEIQQISIKDVDGQFAECMVKTVKIEDNQQRKQKSHQFALFIKEAESTQEKEQQKTDEQPKVSSSEVIMDVNQQLMQQLTKPVVSINNQGELLYYNPIFQQDFEALIEGKIHEHNVLKWWDTPELKKALDYKIRGDKEVKVSLNTPNGHFDISITKAGRAEDAVFNLHFEARKAIDDTHASSTDKESSNGSEAKLAEQLEISNEVLKRVKLKVNTPLSAIKASSGNIYQSLPEFTGELQEVLNQLSDEERSLFWELVSRSIHADLDLSTREERKARKALVTILDSAGVENAPEIAGDLVEIQIVENVEDFIPLFKNADAYRVVNMVYTIGQLKINTGSIRTATRTLASVAKGLDGFTQADSDEGKKEASLSEMIQNAVNSTKEVYKEAKIEVEGEASKLLLVNALEVEMLFSELLKNAIEAYEEKEAKVEVKVHQEGNEQIVQITDSGVGIKDMMKKRIFEPFFSTKESSTLGGLGLSIAQKVAFRNGADIDFTSADGKTTFEVRFKA